MHAGQRWRQWSSNSFIGCTQRRSSTVLEPSAYDIRGYVATKSSVGDICTLQVEHPAQTEARQVVEEVWEVVDQNYLDARGSGFDRARWAAVRGLFFRNPVLLATLFCVTSSPAAHRLVKPGLRLATGSNSRRWRNASPSLCQHARWTSVVL